MADYDFKRIEASWQARWEEERVYEVSEEAGRDVFYCLEMLPYPSGRLHTGHVRNYTIGDAYAHYQRLNGRNVLHPIGWDAFGLPAENAAIEQGADPGDWTRANIEQMRRQLRRLGVSYAWGREVDTSSPEYYRWNQWFFLRMLEKGLAYRSRRVLNWCPRCQTVLANEQVEAGRCWRHDDTEVEQREMDQWFVRITRYAEELDRCLDDMSGWPESVRTMQRNWIGRSEGARVRFPLEGLDGGEDSSLEVFTTRIDTIHGATFMVMAPDHPLLDRVVTGTGREDAVRRFAEEVRSEAARDRFSADREKTGVATGRNAINPFNGEKIPVWVANFVVMDYGTGAIMAVPGHDERDHEFATKYGLPIRTVIAPPPDAEENTAPGDRPVLYTDSEGGTLVDSGEFTGLSSADARKRMNAHASREGFGRETVQFRLRDWGISRQRYWGTPIPVVTCDGCGVVPVPEADLPVLLPSNVRLKGVTGSPLAAVKEFVETSCPRCDGPARRETDTMDTFVDSAWYFYRYVDPHNHRAPFDRSAFSYWFPVDLYVGGIEHATGHLNYCRFFHKMMRDLGLTVGDEPVARLLTQGMVVSHSYFCDEHRYIAPGEVRVEGDEASGNAAYRCPHDGRELVRNLEKMSKSKNNSPDVDALLERFGADTLRLYVLFAAPSEAEVVWSEQGIEGCSRFLSRLWRFFERHADALREAPDLPKGARAGDGPAAALRRRTHRTIGRVSHDIEKKFHFNTAIAAIMELTNEMYGFFERDRLEGEEAAAVREACVTISRLLVPFAPHFAEELHARLGLEGFAVSGRWPEADASLVREETVQIVVQVGGKLRGRILLARGATKDAALEAARDDPKVQAALGDRAIRRTIFVPDRLINIVPGESRGR